MNRLGDCGRLGRHVNVSWVHQEMQWLAWRAGQMVVGETKGPEQYQSLLFEQSVFVTVV